MEVRGGGRYSTTLPPLTTNLPLPTRPHMTKAHLRHHIASLQAPGGWLEPAVVEGGMDEMEGLEGMEGNV